ncbi:hypothetical protein B0T16DRAFT_294671, partial [Cercophora newfieldiana]
SKKRKSSALKEIEVDLKLPEPPSKRARRALKKGKTLPAKPKSDDEDEDEDEDGKKTDATKKKKERSPYGVWVGNLRFNATKAELRKWLIDNSGGTITDEVITRVHIPTTKPAEGAAKPKTPENRGFAYVDFATFEANVAAIALSETELAGRKLLIKDAKSFEGRPKKEATEDGAATAEGGATPATEVKKKNPSTKIFVGNLAFQVTEDDLRAHFEKCGPIRWIKVATFEDTGKCKGYGWVNFEEPEAAEWAVKGFVKIKETIDTLEDFIDEDTTPAADDDAAADGDEKPKKSPKKKATEPEVKIKTRKWWVNKLQGRPLKIELAEDDQTRYKKRFRGGSQKQQNGDGATNGEGGAPRERKPFKEREKKEINYSNDISVARLTGAVVASQGKKTTFD